MDYVIADATVALGSGDAPPATGTPAAYSSGVPGTSLATELPAYQMNAIEQEIMNVIAGGGQTRNRFDNTLLLKAIKYLAGSSQRPYYRANQIGSFSPAASSTYPFAAVTITFPAFSKTGAFRVHGRMVQQGAFTGSGSARQNFIASLSDGTNQISGAYNLFSPVTTGDGMGFSDFFESTVTYAPGATVTFTMSTTTLGGNSGVFSMSGSFFELFVGEA